MISGSLKEEIIKKLAPKKPYKVILFGSHAHGDSDDTSDIDLLVVLNTPEMPKTFKERSSNYLEVNRLLRDVNKNVSMDLVVMTKVQWERFIEQNSGFSRELNSEGIDLI